MKLSRSFDLKVKRLQVELAENQRDLIWFSDRVLSVASETQKLEEESLEARLRGDISRVKTIEEFLVTLCEAQRALSEKEAELSHKIVDLQGRLEEALKRRKVVDKLEELHYNRALKARRKRSEG